MRTLLIALIALVGLFYAGCAHNTIRPIDGVTIEAEFDIDNVDAGLNVKPPVLLCAGEAKLPFPTGKLGAICGAIRGPSAGEAVGEGSVPEVGQEAIPVSYNFHLKFLRPELIDDRIVAPIFSPLYMRPHGMGAVLVYEFS